MKRLSEVEKMVGLKRRSIQEYEDAGLADKPTEKNKYGYLLYDTPEIKRLWQLKFYKELGYTIPQIKELQAKGKKAEKEELGYVINRLKEKREKLDNLISIAEFMNEFGLPFDKLKTGLVPTDDIQADNLIAILGTCFSIKEIQNIQDCFVENILTDSEWELTVTYIDNISNYCENKLDYASDVVQNEILKLHEIVSKAISDSIYFFQITILPMSDDEKMKEYFGERRIKYIIDAIQYYCDKHVDNAADRALTDAFDNIVALGLSKHATNNKQVQNEVEKIYMFFDKIKVLKPEGKKMFLKSISELYGSHAYRNAVDNGEPKGIAWFISRAIEIYLNNIEEEDGIE